VAPTCPQSIGLPGSERLKNIVGERPGDTRRDVLHLSRGRLLERRVAGRRVRRRNRRVPRRGPRTAARIPTHPTGSAHPRAVRRSLLPTALWTAINYAQVRGMDLSRLWLFQVPHHGSRNNISPSVLDRIVGPPVQQGQSRQTCCIISAGAEDQDHPRQVVVNALWRRGLKPYVTRNGTVRFHSGLQARDAWTPVNPVPFSTTVERYD
jgi:hypothetical protein